MKQLIQRSLIASTFIITSLFASGAGAVGANAPTTPGKVLTLHIWKGHTGLLVGFEKSTDITLATPCPRGNDALIVPANHPQYKEIYLMLLTAKANDMPVAVGTWGTCYEGFITLDHIWL